MIVVDLKVLFAGPLVYNDSTHPQSVFRYVRCRKGHLGGTHPLTGCSELPVRMSRSCQLRINRRFPFPPVTFDLYRRSPLRQACQSPVSTRSALFISSPGSSSVSDALRPHTIRLLIRGINLILPWQGKSEVVLCVGVTLSWRTSGSCEPEGIPVDKLGRSPTESFSRNKDHLAFFLTENGAFIELLHVGDFSILCRSYPLFRDTIWASNMRCHGSVNVTRVQFG